MGSAKSMLASLTSVMGTLSSSHMCWSMLHMFGWFGQHMSQVSGQHTSWVS